ncbi:MAG: TVP38/TMEM64 family protein [Candidatus Binatia bacterium]
MEALAQWIEHSGMWAYVLAPLFMIVVAILPIPAEIPAMVNGMVFGTVVGTIITWSGALTGAQISFELARRFGRPLTRRIISKRTLDQTDRIGISAGWPGLLVLRIIPVIAFTAINWGVGFTAVRRWTFFWTTAVGILPGTIVFTASGSGLGALYMKYPELFPVVAVLAAIAIGWTIYRFRLGWQVQVKGWAKSSDGPLN